uniref:Beta/gamma crystallin domain-containing protein 1-like n=3 Tax=Seriola lalandi dorsalis TaxID=1841481 RepID=A0A3B4YJQ8_SERLL
MAKKSSSKKSLKSLFSRSEANLGESVEKDASKNEGEKKKFKFFKLKIKSKSGSAPEKSAAGSQQVLSAAEPSNSAEDGEAWADSIVSDNKRSALYGTAPRSKGKEFSYSEMDLRKPKRFATFSFGFGKRKKKDEANISKSTFGLHSPGIEEQAETDLDLRQMELDQAKMKTTFSMSQPELDTSDTFDIPSPPAVGKNQSGSYFTISNQPESFVTVNTQPEPKERQMNGSEHSDVQEETPKAPIASIPELQLDDEKLNTPVHDNSSESAARSPAPMSHTERISVVDTQTAPSLPASQPPIAPDTSDHKAAALVDPRGNDIPRQPYTITEISPTEPTSVTLSHHQTDAPDIADSTAPSGEASLTSFDSRTDATITESTPVPHNDNDNDIPARSADAATIHKRVSDSHTVKSVPKTANGVTATPAVSSEKSTPNGEDVVYGALYESLFSQSFTSEIMSSLPTPPPQIRTEVRHLNTKPEPVVVKTLDERHAETNVTYSRLSSSHDSAARRVADAESSYANTRANFKVAGSSERFTSYQSYTATDLQTDTDIQHRWLPSSLTSASQAAGEDIPYSELTRSQSEMKSGGFSLIQDTVRSVPVVQNSAPPTSDYVTSQGTDTRVTDSKQRVILVKELVSNEASADSGCPSPVLDKMSTVNGLGLKIETRESFYAVFGSGLTEGCEGTLSPTYLSVGSDDGSAMEMYYSAEEDNAEESEEDEMYTMDDREEICALDAVKEMEQGEIADKGSSKTDEGDWREVTVKIQTDRGNMGNEEEMKDSQTEIQQQLRGQSSDPGKSEFLVSSDAKSQEKEMATTALPKIKEEGEEEEEDGRKEELLATPVQQVNTLMVCEVAPPSSEPHVRWGRSEGNWTVDLETEDHLNGEKKLPSQETRYPADKDIRSAECTHADSSNTREEDVITPTCREAEELVSLTADQRGEVSKEAGGNATTSAATDASTGAEVVTGVLTHCTELQSDATEIEHNRALQSNEWADTITQSTERKGTEQQQVAVELSNSSNTDTHPPDTEPAEALSERPEHPAEAQPDLNQGSLTVSSTNAAASEVSDSESQETKADQRSVDKMNSGYSSLSTKLTIKNLSPSREDDSKNRFHKVSLITYDDDLSQDTVDFAKTISRETESNGTDLSSDYRWRNRFEGVSQYTPHQPEDSSFSDSLSHRMSDTYSSTSLLSSEASTYKPHSDTFSSSFSSPTPDVHFTTGSMLSDRTTVYESHESEPEAEPKYEWRRSLVEQEEPAAPAGEREGQREGEAESERIKSSWESQQLSVSGFSSALQTSCTDGFLEENNDDSSRFTGLFKATLVDLDPGAPHSSPPASPDIDSPNQFDMDSLVDTLKSMRPSLRPRSMGPRAPPQVLVSSLPPIVEDAPSPVTSHTPAYLTSPTKKMETIGTPAESFNGVSLLPADLGLKRSSPRDTRSPLELMKQSQQDQQPQSGARGLNLPMRASATNSIVIRKSSDSSPDDLKSPLLNGNGLLPSSNTGSRLDNSVIFGGYRSSSMDQTAENGKSPRSLYRSGSLPETGLTGDRMSTGLKELNEHSPGKEPVGSRFERFSFLLNATSSASGSLTGAEDPNARMSRPPPLGISSPPSSNSPTRLLSPTGSIDLHRPFTTTDSPLSLFGQTQGMGIGVGTGTLGTPILQRSFSGEGTTGVQQTSLFNSVHGGSQFQSKEPEPDRNLMSKYRAFPDAYLTKEKEHGKLNPRPGKMYIFDRPGMCGQRIEVRSDVIDATPWELQETISIRVIRGGWVLYEKPNFKGEKIALDEGDIELTYPFNPPEEHLQNGQEEGETNGEQTETKPARRFIIGSIRRAVRDYSVPEISLFPEENAEGKKVIFRDTSDDARIFGFPVKANSIIINAGLWLVYGQPFFQGVPRVLEVGGYSNPAAWGVEQAYVGSLHPLKVGEPRVENVSEPKMVIYDKPYFSGKSRTITANMKDFMTRTDRQQSVFMYSVGSLKVLGGIWVGYEKEGFRGHQYLLEEGEYHDWRVWGGRDAELRSVRVIRADLTDPLMVMFEQLEEDQEGMQENTFEVTEAIPDVELFGYKTSTRSIQVLSGAWIAYSHVDFSGDQYILEKGFYNNCADWGSQDTRICSVQPILLAPGDSTRSRSEIILYSEPDFQGECHIFDRNQDEVSEKYIIKSCRVVGGSWVVYDNQQYSGTMYVLSEGDYPNLTSMGCPPNYTVRSVKVVPMTFSVPSISLFGLECLEGREITTENEILNMAEEGLNNHILSVRVNSGCWVICEHNNYRGRQFLLESIEITNWPKFSSLQTIGSMYPVRQKRQFFHIKNKESGHFMSVQGGVEEMKSGRVVATAEVEPMSDIWFYQDGLIKNKLSPTMSLQVMGNVEPAAKVVMWTETRQPVQTWTAKMRGLITSLTFAGMVLDVKGGKTYDKEHVVIMPENDERPSQQWEIVLL